MKPRQGNKSNEEVKEDLRKAAEAFVKPDQKRPYYLNRALRIIRNVQIIRDNAILTDQEIYDEINDKIGKDRQVESLFSMRIEQKDIEQMIKKDNGGAHVKELETFKLMIQNNEVRIQAQRKESEQKVEEKSDEKPSEREEIDIGSTENTTNQPDASHDNSSIPINILIENFFNTAKKSSKAKSSAKDDDLRKIVADIAKGIRQIERELAYKIIKDSLIKDSLKEPQVKFGELNLFSNYVRISNLDNDISSLIFKAKSDAKREKYPNFIPSIIMQNMYELAGEEREDGDFIHKGLPVDEIITQFQSKENIEKLLISLVKQGHSKLTKDEISGHINTLLTNKELFAVVNYLLVDKKEDKTTIDDPKGKFFAPNDMVPMQEKVDVDKMSASIMENFERVKKLVPWISAIEEYNEQRESEASDNGPILENANSFFQAFIKGDRRGVLRADEIEYIMTNFELKPGDIYTSEEITKFSQEIYQMQKDGISELIIDHIAQIGSEIEDSGVLPYYSADDIARKVKSEDSLSSLSNKILQTYGYVDGALLEQIINQDSDNLKNNDEIPLSEEEERALEDILNDSSQDENNTVQDENNTVHKDLERVAQMLSRNSSTEESDEEEHRELMELKADDDEKVDVEEIEVVVKAKTKISEIAVERINDKRMQLGFEGYDLLQEDSFDNIINDNSLFNSIVAVVSSDKDGNVKVAQKDTNSVSTEGDNSSEDISNTDTLGTSYVFEDKEDYELLANRIIYAQENGFSDAQIVSNIKNILPKDTNEFEQFKKVRSDDEFLLGYGDDKNQIQNLLGAAIAKENNDRQSQQSQPQEEYAKKITQYIEDIVIDIIKLKDNFDTTEKEFYAKLLANKINKAMDEGVDQGLICDHIKHGIVGEKKEESFLEIMDFIGEKISEDRIEELKNQYVSKVKDRYIPTVKRDFSGLVDYCAKSFHENDNNYNAEETKSINEAFSIFKQSIGLIKESGSQEKFIYDAIKSGLEGSSKNQLDLFRQNAQDSNLSDSLNNIISKAVSDTKRLKNSDSLECILMQNIYEIAEKTDEISQIISQFEAPDNIHKLAQALFDADHAGIAKEELSETLNRLITSNDLIDAVNSARINEDGTSRDRLAPLPEILIQNINDNNKISDAVADDIAQIVEVSKGLKQIVEGFHDQANPGAILNKEDEFIAQIKERKISVPTYDQILYAVNTYGDLSSDIDYSPNIEDFSGNVRNKIQKEISDIITDHISQMGCETKLSGILLYNEDELIDAVNSRAAISSLADKIGQEYGAVDRELMNEILAFDGNDSSLDLGNGNFSIGTRLSSERSSSVSESSTQSEEDNSVSFKTLTFGSIASRNDIELRDNDSDIGTSSSSEQSSSDSQYSEDNSVSFKTLPLRSIASINERREKLGFAKGDLLNGDHQYDQNAFAEALADELTAEEEKKFGKKVAALEDKTIDYNKVKSVQTEFSSRDLQRKNAVKIESAKLEGIKNSSSLDQDEIDHIQDSSTVKLASLALKGCISRAVTNHRGGLKSEPEKYISQIDSTIQSSLTDAGLSLTPEQLAKSIDSILEDNGYSSKVRNNVKSSKLYLRTIDTISSKSNAVTSVGNVFVFESVADYQLLGDRILAAKEAGASDFKVVQNVRSILPKDEDKFEDFKNNRLDARNFDNNQSNIRIIQDIIGAAISKETQARQLEQEKLKTSSTDPKAQDKQFAQYIADIASDVNNSTEDTKDWLSVLLAQKIKSAVENGRDQMLIFDTLKTVIDPKCEGKTVIKFLQESALREDFQGSNFKTVRDFSKRHELYEKASAVIADQIRDHDVGATSYLSTKDLSRANKVAKNIDKITAFTSSIEDVEAEHIEYLLKNVSLKTLGRDIFSVNATSGNAVRVAPGSEIDEARTVSPDNITQLPLIIHQDQAIAHTQYCAQQLKEESNAGNEQDLSNALKNALDVGLTEEEKPVFDEKLSKSLQAVIPDFIGDDPMEPIREFNAKMEEVVHEIRDNSKDAAEEIVKQAAQNQSKLNKKESISRAVGQVVSSLKGLGDEIDLDLLRDSEGNLDIANDAGVIKNYNALIEKMNNSFDEDPVNNEAKLDNKDVIEAIADNLKKHSVQEIQSFAALRNIPEFSVTEDDEKSLNKASQKAKVEKQLTQIEDVMVQHIYSLTQVSDDQGLKDLDAHNVIDSALEVKNMAQLAKKYEQAEITVTTDKLKESINSLKEKDGLVDLLNSSKLDDEGNVILRTNTPIMEMASPNSFDNLDPDDFAKSFTCLKLSESFAELSPILTKQGIIDSLYGKEDQYLDIIKNSGLKDLDPQLIGEAIQYSSKTLENATDKDVLQRFSIRLAGRSMDLADELRDISIKAQEVLGEYSGVNQIAKLQEAMMDFAVQQPSNKDKFEPKIITMVQDVIGKDVNLFESHSNNASRSLAAGDSADFVNKVFGTAIQTARESQKQQSLNQYHAIDSMKHNLENIVGSEKSESFVVAKGSKIGANDFSDKPITISTKSAGIGASKYTITGLGDNTEDKTKIIVSNSKGSKIKREKETSYKKIDPNTANSIAEAEDLVANVLKLQSERQIADIITSQIVAVAAQKDKDRGNVLVYGEAQDISNQVNTDEFMHGLASKISQAGHRDIDQTFISRFIDQSKDDFVDSINSKRQELGYIDHKQIKKGDLSSINDFSTQLVAQCKKNSDLHEIIRHDQDVNEDRLKDDIDRRLGANGYNEQDIKEALEGDEKASYSNVIVNIKSDIDKELKDAVADFRIATPQSIEEKTNSNIATKIAEALLNGFDEEYIILQVQDIITTDYDKQKNKESKLAEEVYKLKQFEQSKQTVMSSLDSSINPEIKENISNIWDEVSSRNKERLIDSLIAEDVASIIGDTRYHSAQDNNKQRAEEIYKLAETKFDTANISVSNVEMAESVQRISSTINKVNESRVSQIVDNISNLAKKGTIEKFSDINQVETSFDNYKMYKNQSNSQEVLNKIQGCLIGVAGDNDHQSMTPRQIADTLLNRLIEGSQNGSVMTADLLNNFKRDVAKSMNNRPAGPVKDKIQETIDLTTTRAKEVILDSNLSSVVLESKNVSRSMSKKTDRAKKLEKNKPGLGTCLRNSAIHNVTQDEITDSIKRIAGDNKFDQKKCQKIAGEVAAEHLNQNEYLKDILSLEGNIKCGINARNRGHIRVHLAQRIETALDALQDPELIVNAVKKIIPADIDISAVQQEASNPQVENILSAALAQRNREESDSQKDTPSSSTSSKSASRLFGFSKGKN